MTYARDVGYQQYIRSPAWGAVRKLALDRTGHRCQGCGSDGSDSWLEVHHLSYERLGHEHPNDLMVLCHLCHAREHGNVPRIGPVAGPTLATLSERVRETEAVARMASYAKLWDRLAGIEAELTSIRVAAASDGLMARDIQKRWRGVEYMLAALLKCVAEQRTGE